MIRESAANLVHTLYRPLRHAGRRVSHRLIVASPPNLVRQPERYPALDNARFVLITLVIVGHLLEQLVDSGPLAAALYRWIYLFHMPAFVLVSGALSKPNLTRGRALALVTGLLLPYVVFQTLYPAWDAWLFRTGDWSQGYLTPYWLLWYLPSLACWRLLLPLFVRLKFALPLAVAIALAAGLMPWAGYPLSLSRTLVFFPLFLLGSTFGAKRLQHLGNAHAHRFTAAFTLLGAAVGAWFLRDLDPEWLYASIDYAALQTPALPGAAARLALLSASAACALAVLALMPRRAHCAGLGRRSLTAYLIHGFLVRGLLATGVFAWLARTLPAPMQMILCLVTGTLFAALLSSQFADRFAAPLTRPASWLRHRVPIFRAIAIRRRME